MIAAESRKVAVCVTHANVQWPIKITSDPRLVSYRMHSGALPDLKRSGEHVELESVATIFGNLIRKARLKK